MTIQGFSQLTAKLTANVEGHGRRLDYPTFPQSCTRSSTCPSCAINRALSVHPFGESRAINVSSPSSSSVPLSISRPSAS